MEGGVFRNYGKGHKAKPRGGWKQGREVGLPGWKGVVEGKCRQL